MNDIFADLLDVCIVVYLDDILIYLDDLKGHRKHMREVLCWLQLYKLYVSPQKCMFYQERVEFLGYILNSERLQMNKKKIKTI